MKYSSVLLFCLLIFTTCQNPQKLNTTSKKNSLNKYISSKNVEPKWLDVPKIKLAIDNSLTHIGQGFKCDSAIILSYEGSFGEHFYLPLNEKGQWINTIKRKKRLSNIEFTTVQEILGNKNTYLNPKIVSCYEPRIGIIYFRNYKVIGQSAICISCARIQSTAKLGSGNKYASFNEETLQKLESFLKNLNL